MKLIITNTGKATFVPNALAVSVIFTREHFMSFESFKKIAITTGRALIAGVGTGTVAYSLFLLVLSDGQGFNYGALIGIFAGNLCVFLSIKSYKNNLASEKI